MMDKLQSTLTDGKVTLKNLMASLPVGESELIKLIQKSQLSEEEVDQMFEQYDSDKTGFISEEEMESLIKDMLSKPIFTFTFFFQVNCQKCLRIYQLGLNIYFFLVWFALRSLSRNSD